MDQKEYNAEINSHLGALHGIDETLPPCDKPCNVHTAYDKKQKHIIGMIATMAKYTGNGMSSDIAAKVAPVVAETLKQNNQNTQVIPLKIPGMNKVFSLTKQTLGTVISNIIIIIMFSWAVNGKIDKETLQTSIKQVLSEEIKSKQITNQVQNSSTMTTNLPKIAQFSTSLKPSFNP
jgi:hypothetical protein